MLRSSYESDKCQLMEIITVAEIYGWFCPLLFPWQHPGASALQRPLTEQQQIDASVGKASSNIHILACSLKQE